MVLPFLVDNNELLMWERCSFLLFLTVSLIFAKYQKIILLVAVVTFLGIYCLYLYNFFRDFLETDCEKLEATTIDGVERIYLSSNGQKIAFIDHLYKRLRNEQSKRKELEYAFEWNLLLEKYERRKLMEKFEEQRPVAFVEQLRVVEEEKEITYKVMHKKVLDLKEKCAKLEEENRHLVYELEDGQKKVMKLVQEKRDLAKEIEDLDNKLNWERLKLSDLEVYQMTTLEEEMEKLGKELEEERKAKQSLEIASEHLSRTNYEQVKKVEEQNKKLGKKKRELEKKCNKLEEEKKVWDAERENLLVVVDSQASMVQIYKDVLDKEECLMKLFDVKKSSNDLA